MNKEIIAIGILLCALLLFGCTQQSSTQTCGQQNGHICGTNEQCFGKTFSSSDAQTCCSIVCAQNTNQEQRNVKTCSERIC